ncbi:hypothetical protein JAO71_15710 [Olleya sp. YSTF-M6]|uniref:Lipocalin-like domain-containing protein n=1 Tax=Olleya sediminilitoris TaxID=2795739 RepID=A0ABS1WQ59_9FLAO|nr:hypothetical protein [Olleya sediminilitoris]MBL7561238.1 hypothetical protein [Olleya sediminilitoris]
MKNKILFLMIIGVLFSCNNNDDNDTENELLGNWKLIQMTGSIPNSETSGAEMDWQETYVLNANGTFLKSRERDGITTEVSGTYNFNEPLIELNFDTESEIIGSCTSNMKETMNLQSETIFLSSWEACDGPGLKYEKIN